MRCDSTPENDGKRLLVDHARWLILDLFIWFSSLIVCGVTESLIKKHINHVFICFCAI